MKRGETTLTPLLLLLTEEPLLRPQSRLQLVTWLLKNPYLIRLLGIEKIASNHGSIDVSVAYKAFPHIPAYALDRPHREVGLLIGQDNVTLLSWGGACPHLVGNLRVMNTMFGSGLCWVDLTRIYLMLVYPGGQTVLLFQVL
jgi:hypothetical protein